MTVGQKEIRLLQEPSIATTTQNIPSEGGSLPSIAINLVEGLVEIEITALGASFDIVLTLDF